MTSLRLGINVDHIATLRNARGGAHPCPVRAALLAAEAGADGITAHLREDRRHIRDGDIFKLKNQVPLPLNLEMAMTEEMLKIALLAKPHAVCIVPEKREELTTEGGLDVLKLEHSLTPFVQQLQDAGIRVSLFIAPELSQIESAARTGARVVELHTGAYAEGHVEAEWLRLMAYHAAEHGLEVHAGHGLTFDNVAPVAAIAPIVELNIGHFLMGEAMFVGLKESITRMRALMNEARK
ncbi:MAG: pyridoxine 5'-phosphate synthase [Alphaproteobacteria bacterium]|nr:pyridoxine 5'-phosphate synthase [Alphaproteobacteria bacterium]